MFRVVELSRWSGGNVLPCRGNSMWKAQREVSWRLIQDAEGSLVKGGLAWRKNTDSRERWVWTGKQRATRCLLWEMPHPAELSWPPRMRINHPGHNLIVPVGKGMAISSSGECPKPFSQTVFIGNGMCRYIQHTCIAHQSMSKGYSHTKTGILYR